MYRRTFGQVVVVTLLCGSLFVGCGRKRSTSGGAAPKGEIATAFSEAARTAQIPEKYLYALAYLESGLNPARAYASYVNLQDEEQTVQKGTVLTDTAFGLTYKELGLKPTDKDSATLVKQVHAYAQWLALKTQGLNLASFPNNSSDHYYWIRNLASLHRLRRDPKQDRDNPQRHTVQILFAKELVKILNAGFIWKDPHSEELIRVAAANPPLRQEDFPADGQQWFKLDDEPADYIGVSYLPLNLIPIEGFENKPKRVEVLHCPLSLSACMELLTQYRKSEVNLAAHYVIPPLKESEGDLVQDEVFDKIIQVATHKQPLLLTNKRGEDLVVQDAILVMLVGQSGRIVDGRRDIANPTWFTNKQLKGMGRIIDNICFTLSKQDKKVSYANCRNPSHKDGVKFWHQAASEEYRWGDIADFEDTIFDAYIRSFSGLEPVAIDFHRSPAQFNAGETIPVSFSFNTTVRSVELERMARCKNGKVVWEIVRKRQTGGETQLTIDETIYDAGPNGNGQQYYRVKIADENGTLLGWSIAGLQLLNFSEATIWSADSACYK